MACRSKAGTAGEGTESGVGAVDTGPGFRLNG